MKKFLYILFHRSVLMALALLAQAAALLVMIFSFSAYTEISTGAASQSALRPPLPSLAAEWSRAIRSPGSC